MVVNIKQQEPTGIIKRRQIKCRNGRQHSISHENMEIVGIAEFSLLILRKMEIQPTRRDRLTVAHGIARLPELY
jgi:hypothetical protein